MFTDMRTFDGSRRPGDDRGLTLATYLKKAEPVTAQCLTQACEVPVSWQDTPLHAEVGDWLVSDGVQQWPVAADVFALTYRRCEDGRFVKTAPVRAAQVPEPFRVTTLEGDALAQAGDWLAVGPLGEAWPIPADQFAATYLLTSEPSPISAP